MKTDISDLRSQLVEEARSRRPEPVGEDEITSAILAKELGCSNKSAKTALNKMVEDGSATMRRNGPKCCNVYKLK